MNIKQASLGILGLGIGVGTILSLAPISPVQAGSLNRNIVNSEGDVLGSIAFTWDDGMVVDNTLEKFTSLESFSLTDHNTMSYDLNFAQKAPFRQFEYNVATGYLNMFAYYSSPGTSTGYDGFLVESEQTNSSFGPSSVNPTNTNQTYGVIIDGANHSNPSPNHLFVEPEESPQDVPENSLTTALLIIAGLIFLKPHKMF